MTDLSAGFLTWLSRKHSAAALYKISAKQDCHERDQPSAFQGEKKIKWKIRFKIYRENENSKDRIAQRTKISNKNVKKQNRKRK